MSMPKVGDRINVTRYEYPKGNTTTPGSATVTFVYDDGSFDFEADHPFNALSPDHNHGWICTARWGDAWEPLPQDAITDEKQAEPQDAQEADIEQDPPLAQLLASAARHGAEVTITIKLRGRQ